MVYLSPCFGCTHKPYCQKHEDAQKALKGTGVTSAKIRCSTHKDDLPPGTRVQVYGDRALIGCCIEGETGGTGTVVKFDPTRRKFAVMLDEAPWGHGEDGIELCRYQRFYHKELHFLPEPPRETCKCGWSMIDGKCDLPVIKGDLAQCFSGNFDTNFAPQNIPKPPKGQTK